MSDQSGCMFRQPSNILASECLVCSDASDSFGASGDICETVPRWSGLSIGLDRTKVLLDRVILGPEAEAWKLNGTPSKRIDRSPTSLTDDTGKREKPVS